MADTFDRILKFGVGFDSLINAINATAQTTYTENYPAYNIVRVAETSYNIEVAVAGFEKDELEITYQENVLTITGKQKEREKRDYLYKGVAARNFIRKFTLSNDVEIMGADIINGLLTIGINRIIPEDKKPKKIPIGFDTPQKPELLQD